MMAPKLGLRVPAGADRLPDREALQADRPPVPLLPAARPAAAGPQLLHLLRPAAGNDRRVFRHSRRQLLRRDVAPRTRTHARAISRTSEITTRSPSSRARISGQVGNLAALGVGSDVRRLRRLLRRALFPFLGAGLAFLTAIGLTMRICTFESNHNTRNLVETLLADDEPSQ